MKIGEQHPIYPWLTVVSVVTVKMPMPKGWRSIGGKWICDVSVGRPTLLTRVERHN